MTQDEFERILTSLSVASGYNLGGQMYLPIESVLKIIHSNLHPEDRDKYTFDWTKGTWTKYGNKSDT